MSVSTNPHIRLRLQGRSGCAVTLRETADGVIVRKHSRSRSYNSRLVRQCEKHESSIALLRGLPGIAVPKVLDSGIDSESGLAWYDMEYIAGEKFSEFLVRLPVRELEQVFEHIVGLMRFEFTRSRTQETRQDIFIRKLRELSCVFASDRDRFAFAEDRCLQLLGSIPDVPLRRGFCHGDLTFSNLILQDGIIYLIDFLDSFVESPFIDFVKLRQDTKHLWSLTVDSSLQRHEINKISQVFAFFDNILLENLRLTPAEEAWCQFLERMNLLRVLPYLDNVAEIAFVRNILFAGDIVQ